MNRGAKDRQIVDRGYVKMEKFYCIGGRDRDKIVIRGEIVLNPTAR